MRPMEKKTEQRVGQPDGCRPTREQRGSRRGSLVLEVVVSAALLATLLVIINQIAVRLHAQTALMDRHYVAQQTLENLLDEFSAGSWAEIEAAAISDLEIPAWANAKLPQATLSGEVVAQADPAAAKRITLRLGWQETAGSQRRPLSLTTWVYRRPEGNP